MFSSVTASGCASTSIRTQPGAPPHATPRQCCRSHRRCWSGARNTPIGCWPTCCVKRVASGVGPPCPTAGRPDVLLATLYALMAAVLHAGWNLLAKRSVEPFLALWGQFLLAGIISVPILIATGGTPAGAWKWAVLSAVIHVPYTVALGWAY